MRGNSSGRPVSAPTEEGAIRVLIADDHRMFTNAMATLLGVHSDIELVGEAHTGQDALELCFQTKPDVVLTDVSMPQKDGIAVTRELKKSLPETRVLLLTVYVDEAHVAQGIAAGAQGYLLKDSTPQEIMQAIYAAHAGKTFSPSGS